MASRVWDVIILRLHRWRWGIDKEFNISNGHVIICPLRGFKLSSCTATDYNSKSVAKYKLHTRQTHTPHRYPQYKLRLIIPVLQWIWKINIQLLSALLQLHLHFRLDIWRQGIRQRQPHDSTIIFLVLGFGATYIRDLTVNAIPRAIFNWYRLGTHNYVCLTFGHTTANLLGRYPWEPDPGYPRFSLSSVHSWKMYLASRSDQQHPH